MFENLEPDKNIIIQQENDPRVINEKEEETNKQNLNKLTKRHKKNGENN